MGHPSGGIRLLSLSSNTNIPAAVLCPPVCWGLLYLWGPLVFLPAEILLL